MNDREEQLKRLIQKRSQVARNIERVKGRREAAQNELDNLHKECRAKNIDPDKIPETIEALEQRFDEQYQKLAKAINEAEEQINPLIEVL